MKGREFNLILPKLLIEVVEVVVKKERVFFQSDDERKREIMQRGESEDD